MTDHRDIVAAFLDYEPVEAPALERALADPGGRDYFIDLLVLRGFVGDPAVRLAPAERVPSTDRRTGRRSVWWLAAAAVLVAMGTTGGYVAGRVVDRRQASRVEGAVTAAAAPAPTHIIRLENGVTWNEKSGGN
jgi:hypothetical protein